MRPTVKRCKPCAWYQYRLEDYGTTESDNYPYCVFHDGKPKPIANVKVCPDNRLGIEKGE